MLFTERERARWVEKYQVIKFLSNEGDAFCLQVQVSW